MSKISIACIAYDGEKILIAHRNPTGQMGGRWEFPGGKVEEGETDESAIVREFREEFGVTVSVNEKITLMNELLEDKKSCMFTDLLTRQGNAMDVICAFMAILEAVKFKMITIFQNRHFGDIKICAREDNAGYVPTEEELTTN